MRLWNRISVLPHSIQMKLDGFLDEFQRFVAGFSHCHATREVRNICAPALWAFFENDNVLHYFTYFFSPACFRALFRVPGGISTLSFPDTVTVPDFTGCLNCR